MVTRGRHVTRRAVLVPTSYGILSAVVHEPESTPVMCIATFHGAMGRFGPNRIYARVGRAALTLVPSMTHRIARRLVPRLDQGAIDAEMRTALANVDGSCPIMILVGELDHQWRDLWKEETRPSELAGTTVEVVPDIKL